MSEIPSRRILVGEVEPETGEYLRKGLTESGFVVDLARNGADGKHLAITEDYDLIALDVMLPVDFRQKCCWFSTQKSGRISQAN